MSQTYYCNFGTEVLQYISLKFSEKMKDICKIFMKTDMSQNT